MVTSVAVIGVGLMGAPIARSVRRAGFELRVCDVNEAALQPFREEGVPASTSAADCGTSDVVLLLVMTVQQMRDALLGPDGVAAGVKDGKKPIVVVMATVGRAAIVQVASDLAALGIEVVDSPISGGAVRAAEGTLSVMASGSPETLARVRPVLEAVGSEVLECGAVGSSQMIKVLNNVIGGINTLMAAETYRIALENGMNLAKANEILEASTGRHWLTRDADEAARTFDQLSSKKEIFDGLMRLMHKDFSCATELLDETDVQYPVLRGVMGVLDSVGDESYENWRFTGAGQVR